MKKKLRIAVRKFEPFERFMEQCWEAYCAESGCSLTAEMVALDLHELYESTLQDGGLQKGEWDIAHLNTDWILEAYLNKSVIDLNPFISTHPPADYPQGWSKALLQMQEMEGQVVGLPFHDGPECLVYRKDLFEDTHYQQEYFKHHGKALCVPQTWNDLIEVASFFQRPHENLYGVVLGAFPDGHNAVFDFCLQVWTRGGSLVDKQGKININTSAAYEGLSFYKKLLSNCAAIHPGCQQYESVKAGEAFARGEAAMMVNWFGFAALCEVSKESPLKGKVGIAPLPAGHHGTPASLNVYWLYTIGAGSVYQQEAYDFIRFAISKEQDKQLTLAGGIGCRKSTWQDSDINRDIPFYHQLEELHQLSYTLPQKANWAKMAVRIDQLVQDTLNGKGELKALLAEAQLDMVKLDNETTHGDTL